MSLSLSLPFVTTGWQFLGEDEACRWLPDSSGVWICMKSLLEVFFFLIIFSLTSLMRAVQIYVCVCMCVCVCVWECLCSRVVSVDLTGRCASIVYSPSICEVTRKLFPILSTLRQASNIPPRALMWLRLSERLCEPVCIWRPCLPQRGINIPSIISVRSAAVGGF